MPETENERPSRSALEELDERLRKARGDQDDDESEDRRSTSIGLAFRLTTELVAGLVVGIAIGWGLDRWLGTMPWFVLLFLFLGMTAGILNVVKTARRMNTVKAEDDKAGGD